MQLLRTRLTTTNEIASEKISIFKYWCEAVSEKKRLDNQLQVYE